MSEATNLLNALSEESFEAGTTPNEQHIIIGRDRYITVPDCLRKIAVQHDHNIETVTFDCPRYWDENDLSQMKIYVNYKRSDGYKDSAVCANVVADGDIFHFDWTVSRNVTEVAGFIEFNVCIKKTDTDGNEHNHWNSELNTDMYVSEGLETQQEIIDNNPDIVTDILTRIETLENGTGTGEEGGGGGGSGNVSFTTDKSLTLTDGVLSVNTADVAEEDNTLPITSAAVHSIVGNIEILLSDI